MKKEFYIIVGLVAVFSFALVLPADAGTLTSVTVTPTNTYGGQIGNYTVSFIVASSTEVEARIVLIFPDGFSVNAAATSTITASAGGSEVLASSTASGQELTLWLADGAITPALDTIEVSSIGGIQSAYAGGSFTLGVGTRTLANEISDSASSTAFTINSSGTTGAVPDTSPPKSQILAPTAGLSISAGTRYVIQGTGSDVGGSTVRQVEVSVDGGKTWFLAQSNSAGSSFSWEYAWQNPVAGEYTIRVRATDAKGNVESPSAGVKVTVAASAVSPVPTPTPTPAPTPVVEKPIAQMTASELQAKITQLQQQVIALLQQLIQLLRAQL